jgi:nucleoside-diphosphate-sugar epimerase
MKILISGAAGFTGRYFKLAAERAGHEVIALNADLTNKESIFEEMRQLMPDAVVHLAAISFVGHNHDAGFYDVNVVGSTNLLDALVALPLKPSKILLASSANIYGNCEESPIAEVHPASPVNHYAMSKLAMEYMARTYFERLPIVIARPFNYTGVGQAQEFLIPKLVDHFAKRLPNIELGNLNVEREFNDVRMVCDVYLALLTKSVTGEVYNVCSGYPYRLAHVIDMLTNITGHCINVRVNPDFVRGNEVRRLCGDFKKLKACIGELPDYRLEDTLRWMLDELS